MPAVDEKLCLKCFACIPVCASGAVSEGQNGPVFDEKLCTKCKRCEEVCPAVAIKV